MRLPAIRPIVNLSVFVFSLLLFSGCANLEEVRVFSKQSAALTAAPQAVDYWAEWGERSKRFDLILNKLPVKNGVSPARPVGPKPGSELTAGQIASVKSLYTLLSSYMTKLGGLAADEVVDVKKQVAGLVENLDKLPGMTDDGKKENAAYGSILKLVKLPLDSYRNYKIKKLIVENDDHIQVLTRVLSISTRGIAAFAEQERNSVINWYDQVSRDYPPQANISGVMQWDRDRKSIIEIYDGKAASVKSYADAITKVGDMHKKMAKDLSTFNNDSFKRLVAQLKDARSEIEVARKQYEEAFKD